MTPETKKTLIYGGVISLAVGVGLYIFSRYESNNAAATDPTSANAAAQAAADAAAQQEVQLSELASFSGGGSSLSSPSLGSETPQDNFVQEISAVLNAAGLGTPANASPSATPPPSTAGLPQPTPPAASPVAPPASGSANAPIKPVGPTYDHIIANYPTMIQ